MQCKPKKLNKYKYFIFVLLEFYDLILKKHPVIHYIFRLKFGAHDAQFHPSDVNRIVMCTTGGELRIHDLTREGRSSLQNTSCVLNQKVNKVVWSPGSGSSTRGSQCVLAAAGDKRCYLWDTRLRGYYRLKDPDDTNSTTKIFIGGKVFAYSSPALVAAVPYALLFLIHCKN